jgi:Uncharacterised nucleotidyltransferase
MNPTDNLVHKGLSDPQAITSLPLRDWDLLIRQGRSANVLGRLHALLEEQGLLDRVPDAARNHLESAQLIARSQERVIRWEVYCIARALAPVQTEFVLLKGAAYVCSQFPFARGRTQSDVDILVPKSKLATVEAALLARGWVPAKLDEYDQQFYREWSHELPPLYHPERSTVLDVHHNILPGTSRLHPDADKLLSAAEPIPGTPYKRLSAPDMVLHTCAHMFQDGDLQRGLRELTDIDGLLRAFGGASDFWDRLAERAQEMDLVRPLFYGLRYSREHLNAPVPHRVIEKSRAWAPPRAVLRVMDSLVTDALAPDHATLRASSARWLLYVRSHWLRMPPFLLARHLLHQSFRER